MTRVLSVVRDATTKPETVAERVRRLQAEARQAARDHVKAFAVAMVDLQQFAAEIADGGEAYAPGIREAARRLAEDLDARVQSVEAISARAER
ncbi:hypothetical protein [Phenylobacterium kunshanense]|uniref:Uncharacterized protein n=1 Tax=Phenylobacterium kunshanense TaxID=1445034 RepID=A0A328BN62_9CAUL|nr:hypothetical protein [Phenylobacterium kunshanense]RAK68780.1 hypothetical protein DJ019_01855 [Phenylobacterium kunshanense]